MTNKESMEGYRPPFIAGVQQGELLLPNGPFLPENRHSVVSAATELKPIARRWPPIERVVPVIPTERAFAPMIYESAESIRNRFGI